MHTPASGSVATPAASAAAADKDDWETEELRQCNEAFQLIDKNSDGVLTRIEVIKACRADAEVRVLLGLPEKIRQEDGTRDAFEAVFQRLDADDSKAIDLLEFRRVFADGAAHAQRAQCTIRHCREGRDRR